MGRKWEESFFLLLPLTFVSFSAHLFSHFCCSVFSLVELEWEVNKSEG